MEAEAATIAPLAETCREVARTRQRETVFTARTTDAAVAQWAAKHRAGVAVYPPAVVWIVACLGACDLCCCEETRRTVKSRRGLCTSVPLPRDTAAAPPDYNTSKQQIRFLRSRPLVPACGSGQAFYPYLQYVGRVPSHKVTQ